MIGDNLVGEKVHNEGEGEQAGVDEIVYPDEEGEEVREIWQNEVD